MGQIISAMGHIHIIFLSSKCNSILFLLLGFVQLDNEFAKYLTNLFFFFLHCLKQRLLRKSAGSLALGECPRVNVNLTVKFYEIAQPLLKQHFVEKHVFATN